MGNTKPEEPRNERLTGLQAGTLAPLSTVETPDSNRPRRNSPKGTETPKSQAGFLFKRDRGEDEARPGLRVGWGRHRVPYL